MSRVGRVAPSFSVGVARPALYPAPMVEATSDRGKEERRFGRTVLILVAIGFSAVLSGSR